MTKTPGKLFISNKSMSNVTQPNYGTDMRTIEQWANNEAGGIREIISLDGSVTITDPIGPIVNLSVPSSGGGYASLTGTGTGTTPGDLTQAGGFTVNDSQGHGITLHNETTTGSVLVESDHNLVEILSGKSSGTGILIDASGGSNIIIESSSGTLTLETGAGAVGVALTTSSILMQTSSGLQFNMHGGTSVINIIGSGSSVTLDSSDFKVTINHTVIQATQTAGSDELGFFGVTPVTQQGTPVTLADVISLLQAYGLST